MKPLILPWRGRDMPHAVLDINRGCNIRCRACYNQRPSGQRTLAEVEQDLSAMVQARRLHTITIGGGEPTLHPQLPAVVAAVRRHGLRVALMTNGLRLDGPLLAALKEAGLDLVLLHVDGGQTRPDLPDVSAEAVQRLRLDKARLVDRHGLTAGLIVTAYRDQPEDLINSVQLVLAHPELRYLVLTGHADFEGYGEISGSPAEGLRARFVGGSNQMKMEHFAALFERNFQARPFARLPSKGLAAYNAWLSYRAVSGQGTSTFLTSSLLERLAVRVLRCLGGRHVFLHVETPRAALVQVGLNAVLGGRMGGLRHLLNGPLAMKYIVCQQGPTPDAQGRLSICGDCPDAVFRDQAWWPVCLADRIVR
jgi:hypothetical protein